jgi:hypothetical protein
MPQTVGFLLDRELRPEKEREDLTRASNGDVSFLECRMYENYLLEPEAIAVVFNAADPFRTTPVTASEVEEWLGSHGQSDKLLESNARRCAFPEKAWYTEVHGARVLEWLFQDLSEGRVTYDKIRHGETLTRWFLEHKPETLQPIADVISTLLDRHTVSATRGHSA